jgi:hypothetical protein
MDTMAAMKNHKIKIKCLILCCIPQVKCFIAFHKESDINPADISKKKDSCEINNHRKLNENFEEDMAGGDLDIPGSELDDAMEAIGSETKTTISLKPGDNHNNLEGNNG